jgi:ribosomal protein S18 acetylase RimI-like enzyme
MNNEDFDDVIRIDEKVLKNSRLAYYKRKFEMLFKSGEYLETSLVAETEDGTVIGFIMGELIIGYFGISREGATLDTIGVDPEYQHQGIGKKLLNEFMEHLKQLEVQKIHALLDKDDTRLINFLSANRFSPSEKIVNLERDI